MFNPQINDKMWRGPIYQSPITQNENNGIHSNNVIQFPSNYTNSAFSEAKPSEASFMQNMMTNMLGMFQAMNGFMEQMKNMMISMMESMVSIFGGGHGAAAGQEQDYSGQSQVGNAGMAPSIAPGNCGIDNSSPAINNSANYNSPSYSPQNVGYQPTQSVQQTIRTQGSSTSEAGYFEKLGQGALETATNAAAEKLGEAAANRTLSTLGSAGAWLKGAGSYLGRKAWDLTKKATAWAVRNPVTVLTTALSALPPVRAARLGYTAVRAALPFAARAGSVALRAGAAVARAPLNLGLTAARYAGQAASTVARGAINLGSSAINTTWNTAKDVAGFVGNYLKSWV